MNKKDIIYLFLIIVILYQLLEISCSTSRIAWLSTSETGAGENPPVTNMRNRGGVSPSCSLWLSFHEYPMTINYPIFGEVIYETKEEFKETLFIFFLTFVIIILIGRAIY